MAKLKNRLSHVGITFPFSAKANGDAVEAVSQVINVNFDVLHLCIMYYPAERIHADTLMCLLSVINFVL